MSSKELRAGKAFIDVSIRSRVGQGIKAIEKRMQAFAVSLRSIGTRVASVGAGISAFGTAALGGIVSLSSRFAALGDVLSKTRDRTGISASSLSELGYAATQSGTDLATLEKAISKMQRGIVEANDGSKMMAESFGAIGLSTEKLAGMNPEQQFLAIGAAIAAIENPTARAARAMEIFGRSGTQLLPLLTSDIADLRKEARELGVVISDEDATNATNLGDAYDRVKKSLGGIVTQLGAAVAVPFTNIANALASIIGKISAWVAANRSIVQTVAAVSAGLIVAGSLVTGLGVAIVGLGATIASISLIASTAFAAVGAAITVLTSPITLAVAAIGAIGYAALTSTDALWILGDMFGKLGTTATTAWQGIVAALSSGDLETAGSIAFAALEIAYLTLMDKMQAAWDEVVFFFRSAWAKAVESIVQIGASIYFGVAKYFDMLSTALIDGFDTAFVYIRGAIDNIQTAIAKAIIKASEFFGLFSKDQSAQIQSSLDNELAARAAKRGAELGQRMGDRAAGAAQRDAARRSTQDEFNGIVSQMLTPQRTQRDRSALDAASSRLAELEAGLATAVEAAVANKSPTDSRLQAVPQLAASAGQQLLKTKAIGTSSAAAVAAGAFGFGSDRSMEDTAKNTALTAGYLKQLVKRPQPGFQ